MVQHPNQHPNHTSLWLALLRWVLGESWDEIEGKYVCLTLPETNMQKPLKMMVSNGIWNEKQ